jgi:hypothetical protein
VAVSAYLEAREFSAILLPFHLYVVDSGMPRTIMSPSHQFGQIRSVALGDYLDGAVGQVPRCTFHSEHSGLVGSGTPEKNALHPSGDDQVDSDWIRRGHNRRRRRLSAATEPFS